MLLGIMQIAVVVEIDEEEEDMAMEGIVEEEAGEEEDFVAVMETGEVAMIEAVVVVAVETEAAVMETAEAVVVVVVVTRAGVRVGLSRTCKGVERLQLLK